MEIIDPKKITMDDLPLIVLSDDKRGLIPFMIKAHSQGNYNHIMVMIRPGYLVTQGFTYKEISIEKYMKARYQLKFWQHTGLTAEHKNLITELINKDLKQSWWKRRYDFLGILGQALHLRWLNNPRTNYCSERVAACLRAVGMKIQKHPSPADINRLFQDLPEMKVFGYWFVD